MRRSILLCCYTTCLLSATVAAAFVGSAFPTSTSSVVNLSLSCSQQGLVMTAPSAPCRAGTTSCRPHLARNSRRIPGYFKRTHRKAPHILDCDHNDDVMMTSNPIGLPSIQRLVRVLREKRWLVILLVGFVTLIWPSRSASASVAVETASRIATSSVPPEAVSAIHSSAASYASHQPIPILTLSRPVASVMVELQLTVRLVYAALLGALIGKERSGKQHHPAGVRTMALVATGAACFTVCSLYGFAATAAGAGRYDPSRMASNVASGVGFIGAGVITTTGSAATAGTNHHNEASSSSSSSSSLSGSIVHGLTTAAAIWLSAAVGVGCGVGMFILSTAAALLTLSILRIGRFAQKIQEKEWRLMELRQLRRQRDHNSHHKPKLLQRIRRPSERNDGIQNSSSPSPSSSSSSSMREQTANTIPKHLDSNQSQSFSNHSDCVFEEKEDQLVYVDQRPPMGWNETDQMDAP